MSDLPPGFVLDAPPGNKAPVGLPSGFVLDEAPLLDRAGRYARGLLDRTVNGITLGFGDEIGAGADALTQPLTGASMGGSQAPTFGQRYDENLAGERSRTKQFAKENPIASTVADVTGSVMGTVPLTLIPGAGALMGGGGGLLAQTGKGALVGGALGGAAGFGAGEGDERLASALKGAAFGGATGAALPAVIAGGKALYSAAAPSIFNKAGSVVEGLAPRAEPGKMTLSAAAPDGTSPPPMDSYALSLADTLQSKGSAITNNSAVERIARAMSQDRVSPAAGRSTLEGLGENGFLSDLGRNLQRTARDSYVLRGEGQGIIDQAFTARNEGAPRRMISAFEGGQTVPGIAEETARLKQVVTDTGKKLYDPVLRGDAKLNVSPEMADLQKVPLVKEAYATMRKLFADAGKTPTEAELAHAVKQGLAANGEAARAGGRPVNPALISEVEGAWRKALHDANPLIQAADEAYGPIAGRPDLLAEGQQFLKTGISETASDFSPSALARRIPGMAPEDRATIGVGAVNTARDIAAQGPRQTRALADKIATSDQDLGIAGRLPHILPDQAPEILRNAKAEGVFTKTDRAVRGGAADRAGDIQAAFSGLGGVPTDARGFVTRAIDQITKIAAAVREPNEASRAQIARLLTGTREENAQTLALVEALLQQQRNPRVVAPGLSGAVGSGVAGRD